MNNNIRTRNATLTILKPLILLSILLSSGIIFSLQNVYGSTRDYNDGYAIGLSDAKKDQRCLNGHGYDPSIHRGNPDFRRGYTDGYLSYSTTHPFLGCGGGGGGGSRDYNDGYAIGLSDAKKDQRCLNGHGYDPSIHRGNPDFRRGYTDGYLSYSTTHPFLGCH